MKRKYLATLFLSMAASCATAQVLNTGVWFDGSDQQVNTGADCVYEYHVCESTTMGYWYDRDDRLNDHGASYAEYPFDGGANTEAPYYGSYIAPMIEEFGYAAIKYHVNDPVAAGQVADYNYSFVEFGFNIKDATQSPFDISATGGLCVTYTANHNVAMEVTEATSGDDDACFVTMKKTARPTTLDFDISDFAQPTWTKTDTPERVIECSQAFKAAKAVKFRLDGGATGGLDGTLRIFAVGPKGTCAPSATSISPREPDGDHWPCKSAGNYGMADCSAYSSSSSSAKRSSSSTYNYNGTLNTGVWFDGSNPQVDTGADCVYEYAVCESTTMGVWYDFDDRQNDDGGSYAEYPFDGGGRNEAPYYGSYIAPEIEEFGYAAIRYHVNDPVAAGQVAEFNYSFVGFGVNIKDGTQSPFDISATGGLCVTYTSDHNVAMEVTEETSGDFDACFVTMKKTARPTTLDFAIADFKQPTWTKTNTPERVIECSQAFKAAKAVKFRLDGGATGGLDGTLRIFAVGPKGTCVPSATGISPYEPEGDHWPCKSAGHDGMADCSAYSSSSSSAVKSSSSSAFSSSSVKRSSSSKQSSSDDFEAVLNTDVWFDGSNQQVNTGADCMYDRNTCDESTMGYWFNFNEGGKKSGSYVMYPYDAEEVEGKPYYESQIAKEIEDLGYVAVKYSLAEPETEDDISYAGIGFYIQDINGTSFNIRETEGLCVTYTSDRKMLMEVFDDTSDDNPCYASLTKTTSPKTVNLSISNFERQDEENTDASCTYAFKHAKAIRFRVGSSTATKGIIRIFSVGPKGTCTDGEIVDEPAFTAKSYNSTNIPSTVSYAISKDTHSIKKIATPTFSTAVAGRIINISGAALGNVVTVFDLQGSIVASANVDASSFKLIVPRAGSYLVRIGNQMTRVNVK